MSPIYRSMLFVPVLRDRLVHTAASSGAGAIILDLEDSIPPDSKEQARAALDAAAAKLRDAGAVVFVRVNRGSREDLLASARIAPDGLILPKVATPDDLREAVDVFQSGASDGRKTRLYATIETAAGVVNAPAIAAGGSVDGLMFGAGDFAFDTGMAYDESVMEMPACLVVIAARSASLPAYGLAGPITNLAHSSRLLTIARRSKALGFSGSPAIHPRQVPIIEEAFAPLPDEVERAKRIIALYEASDGLPMKDDGTLIEWPLYREACSLLGRTPESRMQLDSRK